MKIIQLHLSNYFDARALLEGMISSYENEAEVKEQLETLEGVEVKLVDEDVEKN